MSGNVWEWCSGWYDFSDYNTSVSNVSRMLKDDIEAARSSWIGETDSPAGKAKAKALESDPFLKRETEAGIVDFHSLRHTFGSLLAMAGVHPKQAQDLMRHGDINLTMSRYTHTLRADGGGGRPVAGLRWIDSGAAGSAENRDR